MRLLIGLIFALLAFALPAHAQGTARVVDSCGSLPQAYSSGSTREPTVDVNGVACTTNSTLPSGSATAANQVLTNTKLDTLINQAVPSCTGTPVVSGSSEASHVLKNTNGTLCGVYFTNLSSVPGFLVVTNTASAPGDGAITPLVCVPVPANGFGSIAFGTGFGSTYSTGITAVFTTATTCFTKTTSGGGTGFFAGQVL